MGFEIDYIPVGDGERSGDAIILRYGNLHGSRDEYKIVVIDGGTLETGKEIVQHIRQYFDTDIVDYVFSTHLDMDHISGLRIVLKEMEVRYLLMHIPWEHAEETTDLYKETLSSAELESKLQKSLDQVRDLEEIAIEKGIPIYEPFAGMTIGNEIHILGPSKVYYQQLLCDFRDTPEAKSSIEQILKTLSKAKELVEDALHLDLLGDSGETSAENNSSTVILFTIDGHKLLLTGDAGIPALTAAADYAEQESISLIDLRFFHVPHHGSKHNLGSSILKRIRGETAYISAAEKSEKHPSKKITNALLKNGFEGVYVTQGKTLCHSHNAPDRLGWSAASQIPWFDIVEE